MKFSHKMTGVVLGSLLTLFCASGAFAQTQVNGFVEWLNGSDGAQVCTAAQLVKASCSGTWNITGANGSGAIFGVAKYGLLRAKTQSSTTVTVVSLQTDNIYTTSPMDAQFNDVLSFPTLPNGTSAVLSVTLKLTGNTSVSNASSGALGEATVYLGNNTSICQVADSGTCTTTLPWVGGWGSVGLQATLDVRALAQVTCCDLGSGSASSDYYSPGFGAKITKLTLKDANGTKYGIVAASGHKYPQ
jgi:hypothetical protein